MKHRPNSQKKGEMDSELKNYLDQVILDTLVDGHRGGVTMMSTLLEDVEQDVQEDATEEEREEARLDAAFLIMNYGLSGNSFDHYHFYPQVMKWHHLLSSKIYQGVVFSAILIHMLLYFFESSNFYDPEMSFAREGSYDRIYITLGIEIFCVTVHIMHALLRFVVRRKPWKHFWVVFQILLSLFMLFDIVNAFLTLRAAGPTTFWLEYAEKNLYAFKNITCKLPADMIVSSKTGFMTACMQNVGESYLCNFPLGWPCPHIVPRTRVTAFLRPLLMLLFSKQLRQETMSMARVFKRLLPALFSVAAIILFFSVSMTFSTQRSIAARWSESDEGDIYFKDLFVSIMSLSHLMFGFVNSDVMLPALDEPEQVFLGLIFFVPFCGLCAFFSMC